MNVLQNLVELYNHLPMDSTYRDVAGGILTHLEEAADATIYDVAELTASSRTTVWRMIQKMGYESYSEFRHALKQSVSHYSYYNRILPVEKEQSPIEDVLAGQLKQVQKSLKGAISEAALRKMASLVNQKRKISFYFPFRSSAVSSFQQNLAMAGKETGAYCLLPDMLLDAAGMDERGLVFCVAIEHAEAQDLLPVFLALKERGAGTAMFSTGKSRYDDYVDFSLCNTQDSLSVVGDLVRCEMYLLALSEMFRREYLRR